MKIKKILLNSSSDPNDCNILSIPGRVIVYTSLLIALLWFQSQNFGGSELILTSLFITFSVFIELLWRKVQPQRIVAHLVVVFLMVVFSILLTYKAMEVRTWWYRTHIVENVITELITNSANPIIIINGKGRITDANQKTLDLLQYSREELTRLYVFDLVPKIYANEYKKYFYRNVESLKSFNAKWVYNEPTELIIVRKDRKQFSLKCIVFASNLSPLNLSPDPATDMQFYAIAVDKKEIEELQHLEGQKK